MPFLNSSHVRFADYDSEIEVLTIVFQNGDTYTYDNVPQEIYETLIHTPAPGDYFRQIIKPNFEGEKG